MGPVQLLRGGLAGSVLRRERRVTSIPLPCRAARALGARRDRLLGLASKAGDGLQPRPSDGVERRGARVPAARLGDLG
jgi:hypothetical protein